MKNNKRTSLKIIEEICNDNNISLTSYSDDWVLKLECGDRKLYSYGYTFGLNSDSIAQICKDKVAISDLLKKTQIPFIQHYMYPRKEILPYLDNDKEYYDKLLLDLLKNEIVIKPNTGTSGIDVYRTKTLDEAKELINIIHKYDNVALSKFTPIEKEFRVIAIDGNVELVYEKVTNDWKHNLSNGAIPLITNSYNFELNTIARQIFESFNIRIGCYDIIISENEVKLLEINTGLMMDHFAAQSENNYIIAKKIYKKVIDKVLYPNKNNK